MNLPDQDTAFHKTRTTFRLGELFSGPGGIALGALMSSKERIDSLIDIKHAWATDYDRSTCETYVKNICPAEPESVICSDVRELEMRSLMKVSDIDALAFGFPCNDFSMVGEQKGTNGNFGPLYKYGVKALEYFKPKWFLAENVGGLRNSNEGNAFETILSEMRGVGYEIVPHLYKFEKYGVPQARHRIIIVGIRMDLNVEFKVPSPIPFRDFDVSSKTAIMVPPIPHDAFNNEYTKQSISVVERLKYIDPGQNAFTANIPEHLQLNVKGAKISQIYKRLHPDRPSYTVTGSGGGGTHVYHWEENRALTNRERARLQTFPDRFQFCGSKEQVRKQIGMAVPPRGAKVIFDAIINSFAGIEYEWIPANISENLASRKIPLAYAAN
ncbi:MAG: DNA cytosine methyltransferase [Acidobacteria bacterium]|nr:DNA cytosine methyltransferase [Acidobacteriota bacterium]